ncbi:MAG: transcriptional regulator, partial [Vicinamibacterales bacterium]
MRYAFGRCRLDTASRELVRDGEAVHLSPKAFELLRLLIDARPSVIAKAELMTKLWPDAFVVEANLPVLIGEVRAALGDTASAASSISARRRAGGSAQGRRPHDPARHRHQHGGPRCGLRRLPERPQRLA